MGHWCKVCHCSKSNESFSGGGHKNHICKACKELAREEIDAVLYEDEISGFMSQSHISRKNVKRLLQLQDSENKRIAELASIVIEVARVKEYKRRRLKFLAAKHPELLVKLRETGLVYAHHSEWDYDEMFLS